jgi:hypothetical protein
MSVSALYEHKRDEERLSAEYRHTRTGKNVWIAAYREKNEEETCVSAVSQTRQDGWVMYISYQ